MALAVTSRAQVRRIKEATFGVTPVVGNAMNLRVTGETFEFNVKKEESKELRSDRQIGYVVPVSAGAQGGFGFHLSYGEFDPELESVLQGTWAPYGTNGEGTTFTADFTATTITASVAPTGANAFTNLQKGQWFRLVAPTNANDGKFFKVSTSVAPSTTVITLDASTPAVVGTGVANVKVQSARLTNGVAQSSYSYEVEYPDVTQLFLFKGMTPGKLSLTVAAAALINGSVDFMGKSAVRNTVTGMPGSAAASRTYDIMSGAASVNQLWEAGVPLTSTFIKSLQLNVDNAQRAQEAIANFGYVGIGSGTLAITGTLEAYFADGSLYDKFLANTYTSITTGMQDTAGNGYVINMPRVNLTSSKITAGAKDQDLMATFEFRALADDANATPALRQSIFVDRVGAALAPL